MDKKKQQMAAQLRPLAALSCVIMGIYMDDIIAPGYMHRAEKYALTYALADIGIDHRVISIVMGRHRTTTLNKLPKRDGLMKTWPEMRTLYEKITGNLHYQVARQLIQRSITPR